MHKQKVKHMLKLKRILFEGLEKIDVPVGQIPSDVTFTLSETDPWEYMLKSADKTVYTRKKGEKQWKAMKDVAADFNLAKRRIADMDKYKSSSASPKSSKQEVNPRYAAYKDAITISQNIYTTFKHPEQYGYKQFKGGLFNDKESAAVDYFKAMLTKTNNYKTIEEFKTTGYGNYASILEEVIYEAIRSIIGQKRTPTTWTIEGPNNKKQNFSIDWNYF